MDDSDSGRPLLLHLQVSRAGRPLKVACCSPIDAHGLLYLSRYVPSLSSVLSKLHEAADDIARPPIRAHPPSRRSRRPRLCLWARSKPISGA